jgi:hypothetical protein
VSLTYGPVALTPGTAAHFQVPKNSVSAHIANFSRYFLGVYFGTTPPVGSTATMLVQGQYHALIPPGDSPTLDIVGNYTQDPNLTPNNYIEFDGNIWLQPISIDTSLGLTGGSSLNFATVTSYLSGEPTPASTSSSRIVDNSSQQRVVTLPIGPQSLTGGGSAPPTTGNDALLRTDALSALNIAAGEVSMYLFHIEMVLQPSVVGFAFMDYSLQADVLNGAAVVTTATFHRMAIESFLTATQDFYDRELFYPPYPVAKTNVLFPVGAATAVRWKLHCNASGGVASTLHYDIGVAIDLANIVSPGTYGNFTPITGIF